MEEVLKKLMTLENGKYVSAAREESVSFREGKGKTTETDPEVPDKLGS